MLVVAKAAVKVLSGGDQERLNEFPGLQNDERRCGRPAALFAPAI